MHDDIDPQIRRYLADLPDPAAPEHLAPRIVAAHRGRRRRRAAGALLAAAACLVTMIAVLTPLSEVDRPDQLVRQPPAASAPAATSTRASAAMAEVRAIDRALQAAYARGAGDDELARLWEARSVQLTLLTPPTDAGRAPRPLRI